MLQIISNNSNSHEEIKSESRTIIVNANSANVNFYTVPIGKIFTGHIVFSNSTNDPNIYINGNQLKKPINSEILPITLSEGTTLKATNGSNYTYFTLVGVES